MDNLEKYLSDVYDRQTVDEGRELERRLAESGPDSGADLNPQEKAKATKFVRELPLYCFKGKRYAGNAEAIRQGLIRERERSEKLTRIVPPKEIRCLSCLIAMKPTDSILENRAEIGGIKERVLFFLRCPKCRTLRAIWEDGKEWESPFDECPRCNSQLNSHQQRNGNVVITKYQCPVCLHQSEGTIDLGKFVKAAPFDPEYEKDRARFVLSEKEGQEYVTSMRNIKALVELIKEKEVGQEKPQVKQLTVAELTQTIDPAVEKRGYSPLIFGTTEIQTVVSIAFTTYDHIVGRQEHESRLTLKKLIDTALTGTNWHLMSDGLNYRLGIVTGRLRENREKESLALNE